MTPLTVVAILRNGIQNGYPFVESLGSWLSFADRIFVLDGFSDDGTELVLRRMAAQHDHFTVASEPWPVATKGGSAIADFSNRLLDHVQGFGGKLMYVQADEVYTRDQRAAMQDAAADEALEYRGYINFWNGFNRVLANDFPWSFVRLFPNRGEIRSLADGYSFELGNTPVRRIDERILHYGWCFPVNILQKHVSHARIYRDAPAYRLRGWLAAAMLARSDLRLKLLDALEPDYRAVPFDDEHPACMHHLLAMRQYDPYVGLKLLETGATANW